MIHDRQSPPPMPADASSPVMLAWLTELMASYPCYVYVANRECGGAKALFRGRWEWLDVAAHVRQAPARVVLDDERASGFARFRLYGDDPEWPAALAEIEVYFNRGHLASSFWCEAGGESGALGLAA